MQVLKRRRFALMRILLSFAEPSARLITPFHVALVLSRSIALLSMIYRVPASSFARASTEAPEIIREWLSAFAQAVRSRDLNAGRALFAPDVVSFGTFASAMVGLDELAERQWSYIWNRTCGFTFDFKALHATIEGDFAWAAVPWQSQGLAGDGGTFLRTGRATYILQRRGERWLAVHSHHSLNPASDQL